MAAKILTASDSSLCVEFGNEISEEINRLVSAFADEMEKAKIAGVEELIPTYRSVTVEYDPEIIGVDELTERVQGLMASLHGAKPKPAEVLRVPVLYGGEWGPDLENVAKAHNMTPEEIIERHCKPEYLIYMMGFLPGFCYLGGLDKEIATPRLKTPRVKIPAGSVGIAGEQTGVYPLESPGGWQLIGQTPLRFYDPHREKPILCEAGMHIQFYPIDREEFDRIYREEYGEEGGK